MIRIQIGLMLINLASLFGGEFGYPFLRVGVTARATALGEGFVSQRGDVSTVMYNPAGLAWLDREQVSASYVNHILDINSGYAAYALPLPQFKGIFGANVTYFNYGSFQGYDAMGNETASYSASDLAIGVFHARKINEQINAGVTIKYIHSVIDRYTASALAMDVGGTYLWRGIQFGASVLNLGFSTSAYVHHRESLPLSLQIGASKTLDQAPVVVSVGFSDLNLPQRPLLSRFERFVLGAEWTPREDLAFRVGYNNQRRDALDRDGSMKFLNRVTGFSLGLGYKHQDYAFDYSFASWGIGTLNRFSLTVTI